MPAVLIDEQWFMIFDNMYKMTEKYNGEGLYWNYWYHVWKTFSASPFCNAVLFTTATPAITTVTVTPSTATASVGQALQFSASVAVTGFANNKVSWSINSEKSVITEGGLLKVSATETATTIKVTATSIYDPTKTGTATVTIE